MQQYHVTGMSCAACAARVEKAVSAVPGVRQCAVNLLTNSMGVEGDAAPAAILAAVEQAGYGATPKGAAKPTTAPEEIRDAETPRLLRRLLWSLGFLLALMYLSMGHIMWGWPLPDCMASQPLVLGLTELLLTAAVMVINQRFFVSGFTALSRRAPNMDTLVALGSAAAFCYSTAVLYTMAAGTNAHGLHDLYFESAAMILALITVGKLLEARSKGKTTNALRGLMALAPKTATLLRDGVECIVPVEQVQCGDLFVVRPGERIAVDGVILEGSGAINESAMTGESIPVDKTVGDSVSAATINQTGFLRCRATRVGEDTTLSQIIRMVSDAAATKAPIAKTADRVSGIFVPVVIALALVSMAAWLLAGRDFGYALARGISVLVISCPCALGLATPVAIMVGNGMGAKHGILFKTAAALEEAGRCRLVVLDKTGTITRGEPELTDLLPAPGVSEETLLQTAYTLEARSEHPLARAIVRGAAARGLRAAALSDFHVVAGQGLEGRSGGCVLRGGKADWLQISLDGSLQAQADALAALGKTPLYFTQDDRLLGVLAVADVLKEDSPAAVAELREMGLRVVLLTGDNEKTAQAIAKQAGITQVVAGVLPDGKEAVIRKLQKEGKVAMVGDGINDAPALTRADCSIAIGAGTDVAIDAADVVLMHSQLRDAPAAIRLSRFTLRNIRENLFWAFCYNLIGIPLAAGVWIPLFGWELSPMFGAAAMSLSSFCVVTNALRLNFAKIYGKTPKTNKEEAKKMEKVLKIEGMMCPHCSGRVKAALEALPGVESAAVSHETGSAVVTLSAEVADEALAAAVTAQGYKVV